MATLSEDRRDLMPGGRVLPVRKQPTLEQLR